MSNASKRITTIISVLAVTILLLIASMFFFNKEILRNNFPAWSKSMVTIITPPGDLYTPLVTENIDTQTVDIKKQLNYKNKYMGWHVVSLQLERFNPELYSEYLHKNKTFSVSASLQCSADGKNLYSKSINSGSPFLGKTGGGFSLSTYSVPDDLPLDITISCEFKMSDIDTDLVNNYGPVEIRIAKISDL